MEFVRGDSFAFAIPLKFKDGSNVEKSDIETLYITCRRLPEKASPIIFQKELEDVKIEEGKCHVVFNPENTQELEYGEYYFDVESTLTNKIKKTKLYKFKLTAETTIHGGDNDGN